MSTRNFAIIAHIDHGKSTLADRLLEMTGAVNRRQMKDQLLDQMDLERERGITIKLAPVSLNWEGHQLNLIDTPGHVDFSYEVSRSLQACEGVLLIVDATQGIQAQTLANVYLAFEHNLVVIPVINKIDRPTAKIETVASNLQSLLDCSRQDILAVSAKTGEGVDGILEAVVERIPPPVADVKKPLRALIFDSYYDDYRGVVLYLRVVDGQLKKAATVRLMAAEQSALAIEVGQLKPTPSPADDLSAGQIGYIVTNLKSAQLARVGDTVTTEADPATQPLPGYQPAKPFVFVGLFPVDASDYPLLAKSLAKLVLTDGALVCELESSPVLGQGWRIGFLGLLHLDITVERLHREYDLEVLTSSPSTAYELKLTNGQTEIIKTASQLPDASQIQSIAEPIAKGEIVTTKETVGAVVGLVNQARGSQTGISYVDQLAVVAFEAPLANLLVDFYDHLKSQTSGYGSLNYQFDRYQEADLVRLDFLIAGELVEALSLICHRFEAKARGRQTVDRLKEVVPRQQFKVALQAAIGGNIIARADLSAYRKDVTAKLYGGDVTRRKKLLEKQKKGKAKMKKIGQIDLPPEVFRSLLKRD